MKAINYFVETILKTFIYLFNILIFSQAVKRSRVKSKLRTQQTLERVNQLKTENELLEEKIKMLTKELGFLKDLFLAHAGIQIYIMIM